MNSPLYIITDAHHLPNEPTSWQAFIRLLSELQPGSTLVTLGDFFDFWYRAVQDHKKDYGVLLEAIKAHTKKGGRIYFIVGNRDFFFKAADAHDLGITLVEEPFRLEQEKEKICFMHGDLLLTQDVKYQKFRKFIRQGWVSLLARKFPLFLIQPLVNKIRRDTSKNKTTKAIDQFEVDLKEASTYLKNDDFLICGHTHIPLEQALPTGKLRVLPAFGDKAEYLYKEPGQKWQLKQVIL